MDDEENSLFNIQVSDASDDEPEAKEARRTGQSEDTWNAIRREYQPKIENGDIHKTVQLPVSSDASKQDLQELVHAVEELYFFRRYESATHFISKALSESEDLDADTRQLLSIYQDKCQKKLKA
ncbi:hypothetical protein AK830_g7481 [Neonectria ditissima]|uniref:Uncharacterized protein n=1 Tax=Neonectria ditissima TaxID=78410 RepID=A0A0P7BA08_9HYPO|nr:hypothetical protein AK830_g7481 [Neonectria ditissima]